MTRVFFYNFCGLVVILKEAVKIVVLDVENLKIIAITC